MATFATLPGDLLTAIASYVDTPHFVVAVAADGDARAAVRRGVDEAERGREAGGVIHQRAMGLIVGLFLDALCRRSDEIPELVIDVLHIAQAVALKHAFD